MRRIYFKYMKRLDKVISEKLKVSRSFSKKIIEQGYIEINGENKYKPNFNISDEDISKIKINKDYEKVLEVECKEKITNKEKDSIKLIYEDEYIYIIEKPAGIITESASSKENTLVDILREKEYKLSFAKSKERDGIVHRLDKDTSGLLIITKTKESNEAFTKMFKDKKIIKKYICIVKGKVEKDSAAIDMPIKRNSNDRTKMTLEKGGRDAFTRFKVLKRYKDTTLVEVRIYTGRTHQIRIHMAGINHPVLADDKYGNLKNKYGAKRQMLHANFLSFTHPITNENLKFEIDLPDDFKTVLKRIEENE